MNTVLIESLKLPLPDKKEILRYCGVKGEDGSTEALIDECLLELGKAYKSLVCYSEFQITKTESGVDLGFTKTDSKLLLERLKNCEKVIVFAATVGIELDRFIAKYSKISPSKALVFQAIGAERIEALCDAFEKQIIGKYGKTVPRVSAGYGDIPLNLQKDIFAVLNPPKNIGLTLNESLLMSPTKSVTAIIGIPLGQGSHLKSGENYEDFRLHKK